MKYVYPFFLFLLCGTSAFGQAQSRGAFLEKIDNNNPAFPVRVEVDKPDSMYTEGEILQAFVTSNEDGYLYLFYRDADAKVSVLFPNRFQQDNHIQQNVRVPVPGPGAGFRIRIGAPFGHELLKVVVSKRPLPFINNMMDFAKFVIAPVDDNAGNVINRAMEQGAAAPEDWTEAEINIRTVPARGGGNAPPPNIPAPDGAAKIHLILAADISSADAVGGVVASDTYNLRQLIENNVARHRLNIIDLQDKRRGNQLTKDDVLREIRNLNANSDDTIFFFYSGHGAFDAAAGQYFALASQEQILRSEVLDAMKSKRTRLSVLISDCCYNQADLTTKHASPTSLPQPRGEMKGLKPLVEKLFFEAEGVVDITASEKGTYGFIYPSEARMENGVNKGSVFTWNLRRVLTTEMYASRNWEQIFGSVRDETNKDYQQVFAKHIQEGRVTQTELKPHAFPPLAQ